MLCSKNFFESENDCTSESLNIEVKSKVSALFVVSPTSILTELSLMMVLYKVKLSFLDFDFISLPKF
jgi:hypothetical protein